MGYLLARQVISGMVPILFLVTTWVSDGSRALAISTQTQSVVSRRDPAYWPFDARSPWNQPIGSGATYAPVTNSTFTVVRGGYPYVLCGTIPIYVAKASDPLRGVYLNSVFQENRHIPDSARPACGEDAQMAVIDEAHATVAEFFRVTRHVNLDVNTATYVTNTLRGSGGGYGVEFSGWHGTWACGSSGLAGTVRLGELTRGTAGLGLGIRHALNAAVLPRALNRNAPGGRSWVWPCSSSDPPSGYGTNANIHMGSLLAIPPWVVINSLGITDPAALELARAMQDYGVYIVDTGGGGCPGIPACFREKDGISIRIDPQVFFTREVPSMIPPPGSNDSPFSFEVSKAIKQLQVVTNSHNNGFAPTVPGGGGIPRRALAPPF